MEKRSFKVLNCLYDISSFRDASDFSLAAVLQGVVDFIPPAIQYPEITCARLVFSGYEVTTRSITRIIEREEAEAEIRKHQKQIEAPIKKTTTRLLSEKSDE